MGWYLFSFYMQQGEGDDQSYLYQKLKDAVCKLKKLEPYIPGQMLQKEK